MASISDFDVNRMVFLFDQFDQDSSEQLIKDMLTLEGQSNEDITLVMFSYGGAVNSLMAILDTMSSIKSKVNIIGLGVCASCGGILLASGTGKRLIGEKSRSLLHDVSTFAWGNLTDLEKTVSNAKAINEQIKDILVDKTKMTREYLDLLMKEDRYLSAFETIELGIADEILTIPSNDEEDIVSLSNEVREFVNSFEGPTKDEQYGMLMYNSIETVKTPQLSTKEKKSLIGRFGKLLGISSEPEKNEEEITKEEKDFLENYVKGEEIMDQQELLNKLKEEFSIDVDQLKNQIAELSDEKTTLGEELEALKAEKVEREAKAEQNKIDSLLDSLIKDGKATQATNEVNAEAFNAVGYERALELAEKMPKLIKDERLSKDEDTDAEVNTQEIVKSEIEKLAAEEGLAFNVAASKYYALKGKEKDNG